MIQQPELTVIMPVYNLEKYLGRALDHLAKQDNANFKLLIVNDGSTDNTRKVAESYRDQFRYFKIINKTNGGLSDARNVGLAHVDTPYFTFHDGDDWVAPSYTDFFVRAFHEHPDAAMVSCGFWIDYENKEGSVQVGRKVACGMKRKASAYRLIVNFVGSLFNNRICPSPVKGYTWNKGYRLAIVQQNHLSFMKNLAFMEDQIFTVQYLAASSGFYCDNQPLYHYWQRKDSMVHNYSLKMIPDNFKTNYIVGKIILKDLWQERRKKKPISEQELAEVTERNQQ
ncbi:glycosyltransferase family 2 protein [Lactobacillus xylocopicola]|uniref:Glycosyl transferase n=1 Tax=Lactobacillus xylocopicola TaxID=2976676 RepID=A0ABM8BFI2_9LACO|nr:glycosyltransferase family 2 protein [Lactobacillus xylocopicola]BDR59871.1 glycosyl transferase [Lactobacillus xylocopicola]